MAEKMTEIVAGPHAILERGHVERAEAVARARRYWQRQADKAAEALGALAAGTERVYHQLGIYSVSDRREV